MNSLLILSALALAAAAQSRPRKADPAGTVVFVCEHGTAKSLIAREWFNRLAAARGLGIRAVSRGVTPEASVPPAVSDALREDGFDVSGFESRPFSSVDASGAVRVVGIGVDLSATTPPGDARWETWDGIPPASQRYAAARDALRGRIETLLETLEAARR